MAGPSSHLIRYASGALWIALLCAAPACTRDVFIGRRCTTGELACPSVQSPQASRGGGSSEPGSVRDAAVSGSAGLSVSVQDAQGRPLVELQACPKECVTVTAVAQGGSAVYAFVWSDGIAGATREVCVQTDAQLDVSVTDLAARAGAELMQRVSLPVRARACAADAGVEPRGVCVMNPSFEGGEFLGAAPAQWTNCEGAATTNPGYAKLPAADGQSYLGSLTSTDVLPSAVQATLCAPLRVGEPIHFVIDMSMSSAFGPFGAAELEIWGTSERCKRADLLWSSPTIEQLDMWQTFCGTLEPMRAYTSLLLVPVAKAARGASGSTVVGGYILLDNLRAADSCPGP